MNENNKKNYEEEYKRTAGIQAPMEEDGKPATNEFTPMVVLIIIVISIGFIGVLVWGIGIVFGT